MMDLRWSWASKALQGTIGVASIAFQHLVPHLSGLARMPGMADVRGDLPAVLRASAVPDLGRAPPVDRDGWRGEVLVDGFTPERPCGRFACGASGKFRRQLL